MVFNKINYGTGEQTLQHSQRESICLWF